MIHVSMLQRFIQDNLGSRTGSVFSDDTNSFPYSTILARVEVIAKALSSALHRKAKCAVLCDSNLNAAISVLSCWRAEMVVIPLSMNYGERQCREILGLVEPDLLLTDNDSIDWPNKYNLVDDILVLSRNSAGSEEALIDVAAILCTSGTTGKPKGAMISEAGLIANVLDIARYFKLTCDDTTLIARPLYHCAVLTGEFLVSLNAGANLYFGETGYNPTRLFAYIRDCGITTIGGTPTLFNHVSRFISQHNVQHSVRNIAISGECMTTKVAAGIRDAFINTNIYNVYGLTEASPRVSYLDATLFDRYPESIGMPLASVSVKIEIGRAHV